MKIKFELGDCDSVNATLELTMTIYEWKRLKDQLPGDYPSRQLEDAIAKMLNKYFVILKEEIVTEH